MKELPPYQEVNFETKQNPKVLRTPSQKLHFPLTQEDKDDIAILERKYDEEENCAGLAAPQIGISKQVIVFCADDPELKQYRQDFDQMMSKTIWINPSYEGIGDEKHEDYEGCFSVANTAGNVKRYKKIRYEAYNPQGDLITGEATGFLARIIQHEIDHLNGTLFIDYIPEDQLVDIAQYRKMRDDAKTLPQDK